MSTKHFNENVTPVRTLSNFEIEFYYSGNGFTCIDDAKYSHSAGRIIVAKPGQRRFSIGSFDCDYVHFSCDDRDIRRYLCSLPEAFDFIPAGCDEASFRALFAAQSRPAGFRENLLSSARLLELIAAIAGSAEGETISAERDKHLPGVTLAKDYIEEHFAEKITLQDLAKVTYMSPNFIRESFTRIIGISPNRYQTEIRLSRAKAMLREGHPVAETAYACGFGSQSYMVEVFRKELGLTPSDYRKKFS